MDLLIIRLERVFKIAQHLLKRHLVTLRIGHVFGYALLICMLEMIHLCVFNQQIVIKIHGQIIFQSTVSKGVQQIL